MNKTYLYLGEVFFVVVIFFGTLLLLTGWHNDNIIVEKLFPFFFSSVLWMLSLSIIHRASSPCIPSGSPVFEKSLYFNISSLEISSCPLLILPIQLIIPSSQWFFFLSLNSPGFPLLFFQNRSSENSLHFKLHQSFL